MKKNMSQTYKEPGVGKKIFKSTVKIIVILTVAFVLGYIVYCFGGV